MVAHLAFRQQQHDGSALAIANGVQLGVQAALGDKPSKCKFKAYLIGFIDIAVVRTGDGKLYLFVAVDRTSKFAIARLVHMADRNGVLEIVVKAVPYHIHTVLTDNGIQ